MAYEAMFATTLTNSRMRYSGPIDPKGVHQGTLCSLDYIEIHPMALQPWLCFLKLKLGPVG
jgi:hypothetical protein